MDSTPRLLRAGAYTSRRRDDKKSARETVALSVDTSVLFTDAVARGEGWDGATDDDADIERESGGGAAAAGLAALTAANCAAAALA